ncbi:MAG: hypothetical protein V2A34_11070 [Lentisphaerota bacterium]
MNITQRYMLSAVLYSAGWFSVPALGSSLICVPLLYPAWILLISPSEWKKKISFRRADFWFLLAGFLLWAASVVFDGVLTQEAKHTMMRNLPFLVLVWLSVLSFICASYFLRFKTSTCQTVWRVILKTPEGKLRTTWFLCTRHYALNEGQRTSITIDKVEWS